MRRYPTFEERHWYTIENMLKRSEIGKGKETREEL
jgi:hypothetical protein